MDFVWIFPFIHLCTMSLLGRTMMNYHGTKKRNYAIKVNWRCNLILWWCCNKVQFRITKIFFFFFWLRIIMKNYCEIYNNCPPLHLLIRMSCWLCLFVCHYEPYLYRVKTEQHFCYRLIASLWEDLLVENNR